MRSSRMTWMRDVARLFSELQRNAAEQGQRVVLSWDMKKSRFAFRQGSDCVPLAVIFPDKTIKPLRDGERVH